MGIITEQAKRVVEDAAREKSPLVWLDKTGEFAPLATKWIETSDAFPYPVFDFDGFSVRIRSSTQTNSPASAWRPSTPTPRL